MAATKLIAYECVATEHQPSLMHPDKLTVHQGEWAFCAFDARAGGHRWQATGGADLRALTTRAGLASLPPAAVAEPREQQDQKARAPR